MKQNTALEQELLQLLARVCGDDCFLQDCDVDLLESGILDSLARVEWLNAVEDQFGTAPQPTQIPPQVWHNAQKLVRLCESFLAEKTAVEITAQRENPLLPATEKAGVKTE